MLNNHNMKTNFIKPGFEAIFSVSLMVILGLPPMLMAQSQRDLEIKIENGDTTINGKNIKELPAAERKLALDDIRHMSGRDNNGESNFTFKRRDTTGGKRRRIEILTRIGNGDRRSATTENFVFRDSLGGDIRTGKSGAMNFRYRLNDNIDRSNNPSFNRFDGPMMRHERRSSQNFQYLNTDKDGISTHVNFHVTEVSNDDLKKLPYVEGGKFEITDLNLVPEFSTGKTLLMFSLPAKTAAEVKLTDGEGKILWTEKALGGSFRKSFVLGLNGIYYLQIKQGHNVSVKKIMKEE
jgi:hypothetical protein